MANPRGSDSADAVRSRVGDLGSGTFRLPNGLTFRDKSKLVRYLRDNPGFAYKHRLWLKAQAPDAFNLAGYHVSDDGRKMSQYEYAAGQGKTLHFWTDDAKEARAIMRGRGTVEGTKVTQVAPLSKPQKTYVKPKSYPAGKAAAEAPATPGPKVVGGQVTQTSAQRNAPQTAAAPMPKGAARTSTGANPAATKPAGKAVPSVFDQAIKSLLGMDPSVDKIDPNAILNLLGSGTDAQMQTIRDQLSQLPQIQEHNLGLIGDWMNTVGGQVEKARQRGIDLTNQLGQAGASNLQGIIGSIGGEANPASASVAEVGQAGQNTLQALGSADAQFLSDMGPLLQGEAASMKQSELDRLGGMQRDYESQLSQLQGQDTSAKAQLALQIAQMNQQAGQQEFSNRQGLAETLAGLALSGQKLDAQTMQFLAGMQQKYDSTNAQNARTNATIQAQNARTNATNQRMSVNDWLDYLTAQQRAGQTAQNAQVKSRDQKIADANSAVTKVIDPTSFAGHYGALAPQELVRSVLDLYRQTGSDLTDPYVRKAAAGAISSFGYKVDPSWMNGWR